MARILNVRLGMPRRIKPCEPEVKVFEWADGTSVVFDPNSLCAVHAERTEAKKIESCPPDSFTGLLFSRIAPDFPDYRIAPVRKIVLNVTHGCNLACKYCFAAKYDRQQPVMSFDTALKALELFEPGHPVNVAFFGGEPLLAWDLVVAVAERVHLLARERGVGFSLHVTTNGTLIDRFKAAALARYGFTVLVSLDGPKEIHNAGRPAKEGDSYDRTMSGLRALKQAGIAHRVMARATFSETDARLVERLDFFERLHRDGLINGVSIEPAILSEGCGATPKARPDREKLAAEWHAAAEWFVARAKAGRPFPFFYYRKLLRRLLLSEYHGTECGAGRGYLTVAPDGSLHACHRESGTRIGDIDTGFDQDKRLTWWRNRVDRHPECMKCWARYLCGGGCPQNRVEVGGSIDAQMPYVCAAKKAMMREVFWVAAQLTPDQAARAAGINLTGSPCARHDIRD